jgi:hypothetical protein
MPGLILKILTKFAVKNQCMNLGKQLLVVREDDIWKLIFPACQSDSKFI